jgi:hypothetical protein
VHVFTSAAVPGAALERPLLLMKLIPPSTRVRRDDQVGRGMDAVLTLALFLGAGYLVDRWLGTTPTFMIVFVVVGSIGLFVSFKARYEATMSHLEAQRRNGSAPVERPGPGRSGPSGPSGPSEAPGTST